VIWEVVGWPPGLMDIKKSMTSPPSWCFIYISNLSLSFLNSKNAIFHESNLTDSNCHNQPRPTPPGFNHHFQARRLSRALTFLSTCFKMMPSFRSRKHTQFCDILGDDMIQWKWTMVHMVILQERPFARKQERDRKEKRKRIIFRHSKLRKIGKA